jgi:hypothetical protein
VGDHEVRVHGFVRLDAEEGAGGTPETASDRTEMASDRTKVAVRLYETSAVALSAKDLDGALRVEAIPAEAAVTIDGRVVARGAWEGRLPLGAHTLEITASGFLPARQEVRLERRKQPQIRVALARAPKLGMWGPKRNAAVGVAYALGAAGVTVSAITGTAALVTMAAVRARCAYPLCPTSERAAASRASTLATASTAALVVGSAGLVAGTCFVVWYRPDTPAPADRPRTASVAWRAGMGPGTLAIEGSF